MAEIESILRGGFDGPRHVVVTFDDACRDFLSGALPVLTRFGVAATIFVPTRFIGGENKWDVQEPGSPRRTVMDARSLRDLRETGLVDIGAHSVDHVSMAALPMVEMRRQAEQSRARLEELLNDRVEMFAYPYGQLDDFSSTTTGVLRDIGYRIAVTTHWGTRNGLADLLSLRRIWLDDTDNVATIGAKIEGRYDWIAAKEPAAFCLRETKRHLRRAGGGS